MPDHSNTIKEISLSLSKQLEQIALNGTADSYSWEINCSLLENLGYHEICAHDSFNEMFTTLSSIKVPTLYWFEIKSDIKPRDVVRLIKKYDRNRKTLWRATPAINKVLNLDTNILYLGKSKNIKHRTLTHLGYFNSVDTAGLQLLHWGKEANLIVTLHVYSFLPEAEPLMLLLEKAMANRLKPLIGKHS
ncbi:hypothetical protein [Mucilaginibacter sp. FT3.2]|uniref:hypothetical protein n=1 Tax=Mucilaginibacter sp. FT3.2 TaxID=2723090 RepID=UPI0016194F71|nr:hypothetical protein [Mucilaginibacter sp. FT3.2]MBB6230863.1 hypothetical protein [Mucilaginibacter sp. FT3.2]